MSNYPERKGYDLLYSLYVTQGLSIQKIAAQDNVTSTTVRKALIQLNVPIRHPIKTDTKKVTKSNNYTEHSFPIRIGYDALYELYITKNQSGPDIAAIYNVNTTLIYDALKYWNIKKNIKPFYEYVGKDKLFDLYITQRLSTYEIAEIYKVEVQKVAYAIDYWEIEKTIEQRFLDKTLKYTGIDLIAIKELQDKNWLEEQFKTKTLSEIAEIIGVSNWHIQEAFKRHDLKCYDKISSYERRVVEYIQSLGITNIVQSCRNIIGPKEIDIFLPDYNLAIEVNGEMWHSTKFQRCGPSYHIDKTMGCLNQGITLFHIWVRELDEKPQIIYNKIKNFVGKNTEKIFARKCSIVEYKQCKSFFDNNHIQGGYDLGDIRIGLKYNDEVVACMCLKTLENNVLELTRYATLNNLNVVGGFSKLLSYVINQVKPSIIETWSNGRFHKANNVYSKNGFVERYWSSPNYFYIGEGNGEIRSRISCQKHKLSKVLPLFDASLSEVENMRNNKFHQVFDCGHVKYVLNVL